MNRLNAKTAEIKILHIEDTDSGHRDVPALYQFADIYITEFVDRFVPSAGDAMRVRDIIRAKIISSDPIIKASTKGNKSLGVLHSTQVIVDWILTIDTYLNLSYSGVSIPPPPNIKLKISVLSC